MKFDRRIEVRIRLNKDEQFKVQINSEHTAVITELIIYDTALSDKTNRSAVTVGWIAQGETHYSVRAFVEFSDIPPHILNAVVKEFNRKVKVSL